MINPTMMTYFSPLELSELLEEEGYAYDEETGEVWTEPGGNRSLLILLTAMGKLKVERDYEFKLTFYVPHIKCYNSLADYCQEFPNEQQCKCYDV
jgi:hypothetical protein